MKFGTIGAAQAHGVVLAHAIRIPGLVLGKGEVLDARHIAALQLAGIETVIAAQLEAGDIGENDAASRLAKNLIGTHLRVGTAFTGRANIFSDQAGLLLIDTARVDSVNTLDESVTLATLPAMRAVIPGEMVATVKIIPFAVSGIILDKALAIGGGLLSIAPWVQKRIGVISTLLPGLKSATIDKTLRVLENRLKPAGSVIGDEIRCAHAAPAIKDALLMTQKTCDLTIIFGASAITDRRDVIPAALEAMGGHILHLGMPVDPGNLLLLGRNAGGAPVIGAPGCARSPRENGFDFVLQRLLADIPVCPADIQTMGVGGLLTEIVSRPQPRDGGPQEQELEPENTNIGARND